MAFLIVMAAWSYVMAAYSNPGIVSFETLAQYEAEDLNRKLVEMFKNVSEDKGGDEFESDKQEPATSDLVKKDSMLDNSVHGDMAGVGGLECNR